MFYSLQDEDVLSIKAISFEITGTANSLFEIEQITFTFYCQKGECPFPKYEFLLSFCIVPYFYEAKVMKAFQI